MKVLVTGGAGYIGSHFVRLLTEQGVESVVVDNLSAGSQEAVAPGVPLICADAGDRATLRRVLSEHKPDAAVHFAGLIQVGESVQQPARYWSVNLGQTLALMDELVAAGVRIMVFSSTAAVYGEPREVPIPEDHPKSPINAYGASKLAVEMALAGYGLAYGLRHAALRYFNAAGAHPDGSLRERHDPETHLVPLALDAALGRGKELTVFGDDWATPDGTCVRDYIHVQDLASAHLLALQALEAGQQRLVLNLGTGEGISVRQILRAVERVAGKRVPFRLGARRPGDPPALVAASHRARDLLGWKPVRSDVDTIIADALRSRA